MLAGDVFDVSFLSAHTDSAHAHTRTCARTHARLSALQSNKATWRNFSVAGVLYYVICIVWPLRNINRTQARTHAHVHAHSHLVKIKTEFDTAALIFGCGSISPGQPSVIVFKIIMDFLDFQDSKLCGPVGVSPAAGSQEGNSLLSKVILMSPKTSSSSRSASNWRRNRKE